MHVLCLLLGLHRIGVNAKSRCGPPRHEQKLFKISCRFVSCHLVLLLEVICTHVGTWFACVRGVCGVGCHRLQLVLQPVDNPVGGALVCCALARSPCCWSGCCVFVLLAFVGWRVVRAASCPLVYIIISI